MLRWTVPWRPCHEPAQQPFPEPPHLCRAHDGAAAAQFDAGDAVFDAPPPRPRLAGRLEALRPGRPAGLLAAVALLALLLQLGIETVAPQRGGLLSTATTAAAAWQPVVTCALRPSCLLAQPRAAATATQVWAAAQAARASNAAAALRTWPADWRARRRQQRGEQEEAQRALAAAVVGTLQSELATAVGKARSYRQQLAAVNASVAEAAGALASCRQDAAEAQSAGVAAREAAAAEVKAAKEAKAVGVKAAREAAAVEVKAAKEAAEAGVKAAKEAAAKAATAAQAVNRQLQQELGVAGTQMARLAAEKDQGDKLRQIAAAAAKRAGARCQ